MKYSKQLLTMIVIMLNFLHASTQSLCHSLCDCSPANVCRSCYNDFQSSSDLGFVVNGSCPCPIGFYSSNNYCFFCQSNCMNCIDAVSCNQCNIGYSKINGACIRNNYFGQTTWKTNEIDSDFNYDQMNNLDLFAFKLFPNDPTITSSSISCPILSNLRLLSVRSTGNLSLSLTRSYFGLPYHQWAHLTVKYLAIDTWANQSIQVSIYQGQNIATKRYNNTIRNQNLCGANDSDSIDQINSYFSHSGSSLAINIAIPANVTLVLLSLKLDVGTCPRGCLSCSSPIICLNCQAHYDNINGSCYCNSTLGQITLYGCIQACKIGYTFSVQLQKCKLCIQYLSNCYSCSNNTVCLNCHTGSFLYNGICIVKCPANYFPLKSFNTNISSYCHKCSQNCTSCYNQTICIKCDANLYLSNGSCQLSCSVGEINSQNRCFTQATGCSTGCLNCNSAIICIQCQIGFWLFNHACVVVCPQGTFETPLKTCQFCSSGCLQCTDNLTCQRCELDYILIGGGCKLQLTSCVTSYYFDQTSQNCILCPEGCISCIKQICFICNISYFLQNGKCINHCSLQKYQAFDNVYKNTCQWNQQLCQVKNSTNTNYCLKCTPQFYPLGLNQFDFQCRSYCPTTFSFNNLSSNITDTARICNQSCTIHCVQCSHLICLKCQQNYYISQVTGQCISSCQPGYVSDSIQCFQCPFQCNSCDFAGNCFSWAQTPSATSCPANCTSCISNTCVRCQSNFFLNLLTGQCQSSCIFSTFSDPLSLQCRKCSPQCLQCSSFYKCSKCVSSYYLNGQICLRQCPLGKYPNSKNGTCSLCSKNCLACFGPGLHQCLTCYLNYDKDNSQCTQCPTNKYRDSSGQCDWCHPICKYCFGPAQFNCLQCNNGSFLYQSQCFPNQCPNKTFINVLRPKECLKCQQGCIKCTSLDLCQMCQDGKHLVNSSCIQNCPLNTYYSSTNSSCVQCSLFCQLCQSASKCLKCSVNYTLVNNICQNICSRGTYAINYNMETEMICKICPMNCSACNSWFQCTNCTTGVLRNGQCANYCDQRKYLDISVKMCRSCNIGCSQCTISSCNQCLIGYYFSNGACVQSCPSSTFISYTNVIASCINCSYACLSCTNFYHCTQCKSGFSLKGSSCVNISSSCSAGCQNCIDSNNCLVCRSGLLKLINSTGSFCISSCPSGLYQYASILCKVCSSGCLSCTEINTCNLCQPNLILYQGVCIQYCYPGFYLKINNSTKMCQSCSEQCFTCSQSPTNCLVCSKSYFVPVLIGSTISCKSIYQCIQPNTFYEKSLKTCLPCIRNCQLCHNQYECDSCSPGYILDIKNQCFNSTENCYFGSYKQVLIKNNIQIQQCAFCQFPCIRCLSNNHCAQCALGFPLNVSALKCQQNCDIQPSNFIDFQTNKCAKCNGNCLSCIENSQNCLSCKQQYFLTQNKCIKICPVTTFAATNIRECLRCSDYCLICTSKQNCVTCHMNMVNFVGKCFNLCPQGYFNSSSQCLTCAQPCRQCSSSGIYSCQTCITGYFLYQGRCMTICPDGYFKNIFSSSCRPCPTQCLTCSQFYKCLTCQIGYSYNSLTYQCQNNPVCPPTVSNCLACVTNTSTFTIQCSQCKQNYFLIGGQCLRDCLDGYYESKVSGKCELCTTNCTSCASASICNDCQPNFYILNGLCYSQCPFPMINYTYIQNNITIESCMIDYCSKYDANLSCLLCTPPYIMQNNICVQKQQCEVGTFKSLLTCQLCSIGCQQCLSMTKCLKCRQSYHLYNGLCIAACPIGTFSFLNSTDNSQITSYAEGECVLCVKKCLQCQKIDQCKRCDQGYFLNQLKQCQIACSDGYYPSQTSLIQQCKKCSKYCLKCTSLDFCIECNSTSSYLYLSRCINKCPYGTSSNGQNECISCQSKCLSCGSNGTCYQCQSGYLLDLGNNKCVIQCPLNTYVSILKQCKICLSICQTCLSASKCLSCFNNSSQAYLYQGICMAQCPSGTTSLNISLNSARQCVKCDPFCKQCSNMPDNCTVCFNSYFLYNGYCRNTCPTHTFMNSSNQCQNCSNSNTTKCQQCFGIAGDECLKCYMPYFLLNGQCVNNCPIGYYNSQYKCLQCDISCISCNGSNNNCTQCYHNYYLVDGRCHNACPSKTYSGGNKICYNCLYPCKQCISASSCYSCQSGFYLTPMQRCETNCSQIKNQNIKVFSSYLNILTSECQYCPQNCLVCSALLNCSSCVYPYKLFNNLCFYKCPSNTYMIMNNNISYCQLCTQIYCTTCKNSTLCTSCQPGSAYLYNGDCVESCPSNYYAVNNRCVRLFQNALQCSTGFWFNSTTIYGTIQQCKQFCPVGYYSISNQCLSCPVACLSCVNSSFCQICQQQYMFNNGLCITVCPQSTLQLNKICVSCSKNCQTCDQSNIQCITCFSGYYLIYGQCVQICPDGFYSNTNTGQCLRCSLRCSKCSSQSSCTTCINSRYSAPTCTDNSCISSSFKLQSNGQCTNCHSSCTTCINASPYGCVSCSSPSMILSLTGQCKTLCENGTTLNANNNTCVSCSLNCLNCSYNQTQSPSSICIQCFSNSFLSGSQCLTDCSLLQSQLQKYVIDTSGCIPCSINCQQCIVNDSSLGTTSCSLCSSGYILHLGQCINNCPPPYFPIIKQNGKQCTQCKQNCEICQSSTTCSSCLSNTYLYNNECLLKCPSNTYTNTTTNKCLQCLDKRCRNCNTTGANVCNECQSPFFVNNISKECDACQQRYMWNASTKICQKCVDTRCHQCFNSIQYCTACQYPYVLINGACVEKCSQAYYQQVTTNGYKQCRSCSSNCSICISSANCSQCSNGYYLKEQTRQCVLICPADHYIFGKNKCNKCKDQCNSCLSFTQCTSCITSYYLFNNQCLNSCPKETTAVNQTCKKCITGCIQCISTSNCITCRSDYFLNSTSQICNLIPLCTQGLYPDIDGLCHLCATSCLSCTSLLNCTRCTSTFYLTNGKCQLQCLPTQYSISVPVANSVSKICINCPLTCDRCSSDQNCSHCYIGYYLNLQMNCVSDCGYGYYNVERITNVTLNTTDRLCIPCLDLNCKICSIDGCLQCNSQHYLFGLIQPNKTNGSCVSQCPSGFYKDNTATPLSCKKCIINRCDKCTSTQCLKCMNPYFLFIDRNITSCLSSCPNNLIPVTNNNITKCERCVTNCLQCYSQQWCIKCDIGFYLHVLSSTNTSVNTTNITTNATTIVNVTTYNTTCVQKCPIGYYNFTDIMTTNNNTCNQCQIHCLYCQNSTYCVTCQTPLYVLFNDDCIPTKCQNCVKCSIYQTCTQCKYGYYLDVDQKICNTSCKQGYYADNVTRQCLICMQFCKMCINSTICELCQDSYNFTGILCVPQGYFVYGSLSNMSEYTANITQKVQLAYIGVSVAPALIGQMISSYFAWQFCQMILFHTKYAQNNSQFSTFIQSLQQMSLTISPAKNKENQKRRILLSNFVNPQQFLIVCSPIFGVIGFFAIIYLIAMMYLKYGQKCCQDNTKLKFYTKQICIYISKRFNWVYFDFIMWISFIPFLYFSLLQLQNFSFQTPLKGFSCIFSIIIVSTYPLYPFFILYLIIKNYDEISKSKKKQIQISLYPYINKVKRPTHDNDAQQSTINKVLKIDNLKIIYIPVKYIRKLIFIMVIIFVSIPKTSIITLIAINGTYIIYLILLRPKLMPYIAIQLVIQLILVAFQSILLVFITNPQLTHKTTLYSIIVHSLGFIASNFLLIVAIAISLVTYYKLFLCACGIRKHLKRKQEGIQDSQIDEEMSLDQQINKQNLIGNNADALKDKQIIDLMNVLNIKKKQQEGAKKYDNQNIKEITASSLLQKQKQQQREKVQQYLQKQKQQVNDKYKEQETKSNNLKPNYIQMQNLQSKANTYNQSIKQDLKQQNDVKNQKNAYKNKKSNEIMIKSKDGKNNKIIFNQFQDFDSQQPSSNRKQRKFMVIQDKHQDSMQYLSNVKNEISQTANQEKKQKKRKKSGALQDQFKWQQLGNLKD